MPKTPLVLEARERLRWFGDQLYYIVFADSLAGTVFDGVAPRDRQSRTVEVFPENGNARGINVTIENLPTFREAALKGSFGALVTAAFEVWVSYADALPELLGRLGKRAIRTQELPALEDSLKSTLESAGVVIDRERYETLKYLRLRRNQIAHLRDQPTTELATLIRTRGTHLMRYWNYEGALDFSATPMPDVGKHEAIGLLRFMRILLDDFDGEAADFLDVEKVVGELHVDVLESQRYLRGPNGRRRRARKIASVLEILYGIDLEPDDVEGLMPSES